MDFLHEKNIYHGRLTISNILLNKELEPKVTDVYLNDLVQNDDKLEKIVALAPEVLNGQEYTQKSDVYSYGILAIQIFKSIINVYYDKIDKDDIITEYIANGVKPNLPTNIPLEMQDIISKCLEFDPESRPKFKEILEKIPSIIQQLANEDIPMFTRYYNNISGIEEELGEETKSLKHYADGGDMHMMYRYACARLQGDQCLIDRPEALKYLHMAAEKGHAESKKRLRDLEIGIRSLSGNIINTESKVPDQKMDKDETQKEENNDTSKFTSLYEDPYFMKEKLDFQTIISSVRSNIKNNDIKEFKEYGNNFILSKGAKERLTKLSYYIECGVPVLLEGPTGTSKTLSAEVVCSMLEKKLVRFNLSSETKVGDLLGRYSGDDKSWAGVKHVDGPFVQAFSKGYCLLLDEINLASENVLQCIQESLDSGVISIEIPGMPLKEIKMNEGAKEGQKFCLIATQNPNKGLFAHKRQDLGVKFLSRFQVINFPSFDKEELLSIAQGLAESFGFKDSHLIRRLVNFHHSWSNNQIIANDVQCFTIREIAATVKALSDKESIFSAIMTIYGARYQNDIRKELVKCFQKCFHLSITNEPFVYPETFPECFRNESLSNALKSIIFSFKNKRHVILTGKQGCGKTQLARWVSRWHSCDQVNDCDYYYVCTEETKCSDLVGRQRLPETAEIRSELIKWENGFLTNAIIKGRCAVLDNLDEAPSTVSERLNGLLDQKYDDQEKIFELPENPSQKKVRIDDDFRLLCTCDIEKIHNISPAFLNRFDIIVLEDQLTGADDDQLKEFVRISMKRYGSVKTIKSAVNEETDSDDSLIGIEFGDDEKEEEEEKIEVEEYVPSQSMIDLVVDKIKGLNISMASKICKAIVVYSNIMPANGGFKEQEIVQFAVDLLQGNPDFEIPDNIKEKLKSLFQTMPGNEDNKFFYEESETLVTFMCKLMAASLINQHVCVSGPTGAGKTSAARAFSRMRFFSKSSENFQMHSFHSGTKPNHFYGTTTIIDEKVSFMNGTLTTAMKNGETFIADEMNLSTASTMKSLAPALEPNYGESIFISGIDVPVVVNPNFFFIACQNKLGTVGRNAVPSSIASRFLFLDYPNQERTEIEKISVNIFKSNYSHSDTFHFTNEDEEQAKKIGQFMIELNACNLTYIPQWSLRDIFKLSKRIYRMKRSNDCFLNFEIYHHVLFYTMSPVIQENMEATLTNVIKVINRVFDVDEDLYKCFASKITFQEKGRFIMKGNVGISLQYAENYLLINEKDKSKLFSIQSFELHSLWDAIFNILLSDLDEPILLMGSSSFKTFLAKEFLKNSSLVTLNQESTISQLLGSSGFFTSSEAKLFYLEYICKICRANADFLDLKNYWLQGKSIKKEVEDIYNNVKNALPDSFRYAVEHLMKKLFDKEQASNCVLSNITLEFRPGVFLNAILERKSLILKNITNLPTIVLERFNELLSGKQDLTLNEDIHDTFTKKGDRKLKNFNESFRVFATCSSSSVSKLSEAILSRFTVIATPDYQNTEIRQVIDNYVTINNLKFDRSNIDLLINLTNEFKDRKITLSQMIKSIELCSLLNQKNEGKDQLDNLSFIVYRLFGGLTTSSKARKVLREIIARTIKKLPLNVCSFNGNPISVQKVNTINGIKSNISGFFIEDINARDPGLNVAFTPIFNEMIDVLHLGIMIQNPVILEGPPGQGKQLAIKFIAQSLGYEVVNIIISESTKVEDLLGKISVNNDAQGNIEVSMIETRLVKALNSNNTINKTIIVFHNLNNASPAVLNVLDNIFDTERKSITLTDGKIINKEKQNIVGIFNSYDGFNSREKLPASLIISSIYYIVRNLEDKDISAIIAKVFESTEFRSDVIGFSEKYGKTRKICSSTNTNVMITLNDIVKYVTLRRSTLNILDEATISQMIFAYRFPQEEMTQLVLKELKFNTLKLNPQFDINVVNNEVYIRVSMDSETGIKLPIKSPINVEEIELMINSLTLPQKQCLIFLACSILSKRACMVQGGTASGKSHIVRLFAKMLGKKLFTYQMNSETGISILSGQSILENRLTEKDIISFTQSMNKLKDNQTLSSWISENIDDNPEKWNPQIFHDLLKKIDQVLKTQLSQNEKLYIGTVRNRISQTMNPAKRFHHVESSFIKAMTEGHWVLIDGIESAPTSISEKLSSLCGDDPELNLYECGQNFYFSKKYVPKSRHIHEDFHLFVTFNPVNQNERKALDHSFSNKCLTFTLPPIDSSVEYSAQVLLGSLTQSSIPADVSIETGARMANMHSYAKKESERDQESFAGDMKFTGRTLKFVSKAFSSYIDQKQGDINETIYQPICQSIKSFYWNSYINDDKKRCFRDNTINKFSEKPSNKLLTSLNSSKNNPKERNFIILNELLSIQNFVIGKNHQCSFDLQSFVKNAGHIRISDLPFIFKHLADTNRIIRTKGENKEIFERFGCLQSIQIIFNEMISNSQDLKATQLSLSIESNELFECKSLEKPLSQFHLLRELMKNNTFFEATPFFFSNSSLLDLLQIIIRLTKQRDFDSFVTLLEYFNAYPHNISLTDKIFPYLQFFGKKYELICYIIPLLTKLYETKTNCTVMLNDKEIRFNFEEEDSLRLYLYYNDHGNLILGNGSYMRRNDSELLKVNLNLEDFGIDKVIDQNRNFYKLFGLLCMNKSIKSRDLIKLSKNSKMTIKNDQYSCLSLLFINSTETGIISKLWSVAFYMPIEDVSKILDYLHPIEADILKGLIKFKSNLIRSQIPTVIDFTNWLCCLGRTESFLWRKVAGLVVLSNIKSEQELRLMINEIHSEIKEVEKGKLFDKKIWSNDNYIEILQQLIDEINNRISNLILNNKEKELAEKYRRLIDRVEKAEIPNMKIGIQKQVLNYLSDMSKNGFNQSTYAEVEIKVEKFLEMVQKNIVSDSTNEIHWPCYIGNVATLASNKQKLFDILIWYSKMHSLLDLIIYNDNYEPMESIIELSKHQEMNNISELLMDILMRNKNSKIKEYISDVDALYSTLNAIYIFKMHENNCFDFLTQNIAKIFNDYIDRIEENEYATRINESDYVWAHNEINRHPIDFGLIIPKLQPTDIIFLFINKNGQSSDNYTNGPIIASTTDIESFLRSLKEIIYQKPKTLLECAMLIGEIALRVFIDPKIEIPSDTNGLIKILKTIQKSDTNRSKIIEWIIILLNLHEQSSANDDFLYNDCAFIDSDCINDCQFVCNYPSFAYWLVKNYQCWKGLQDVFSKNHMTKDKNILPLWLHCLRIMSSGRCIKFETKSDTKISRTISCEITISIFKALRSKKIQNYGFINLLLANVPSEYNIPRLRIIYSFLNNLAEDSNIIHEFLQRHKVNGMKDFVQKLFDTLFNDDKEIDAIYSSKLDNDNIIVQFIKDPAHYIRIIAKDAIEDEFEKIGKSSEFKQIKESAFNVTERLHPIIDELEQEINQANENILKERINESEENRKSEINHEISNIREKIDKYYTIFDTVNNLDKNKENYQVEIRELVSLFDELKNVGIFGDKELLTIREKRNKKNPSFLKMKIRKKVVFDNKIKYQVTERKLYHIKENIKSIIENYVVRKVNENDKTVPKPSHLNFGSESIQDSRYIDELKMLDDKVSEFQLVVNDIYYHTLDVKQYQYLEELKNKSKLLTDNCSTQDITRAHLIVNVSALLNKLKPLINQFDCDLGKFIRKISNSYNKLQELNKICPDQMFSYIYSIQDIKKDKEFEIPKINSISNIDILTSPILNVSSDNKIICCYKSIYCSIGPLNPALYSENIIINILSFVDEDLSCSINLEKYNEAFSVDTVVTSGKILKIYISPSKFNIQEIIEEKVEGMLIISSKSYQQLSLKMEFDLKLIPNDILFSCDEFKIAYEKENYRLVADKLSTETELHFHIKNYHSIDIIDLSTSLSSLEQNECEAPTVSIDKECGTVSLKMPSVETAKRMSCLLEIGYSSESLIKLLIESILVPLEFDFEVYDPSEKRYVKDEIVIYSHNNETFPDFTLYFKLDCYLLLCKENGNIKVELPNQIKSKIFEINERFVAKRGITNFKLVIDHSLLRSKDIRSDSNYIQVQIGSQKKKIKLYFSRNEALFRYGGFTKYVNTFPTYMYIKDEITKVNDKMIFNEYNRPIIASVFSSYSKPSANIKIQYIDSEISLNQRPSHDEYIFLLINMKGDIKWNKISHIEGYETLIGVNKYAEQTHEWFPAFNIYPLHDLSSWTFLPINDSSYTIARDRFNNALNLKSEQNPYKKCDYFSLMYFLYQHPKYVETIFQNLPVFLRNIYNDKLHTYFPSANIKEHNDFYMIRAHNFVLKTYQYFFERYKQIETNLFFIRLQNEDEIAEKMMIRAYNEYHTPPTPPIYFSNYHYNEIEDRINQISLIPISSELLSNCFLIEEKDVNGPKPSDDKQEIHRFETKDLSSIVELDYFSVELPEIKLPDIISIESLIQFYNLCQNATKILPLYLRNIKIKGESIEEVENYFIELYKIYISHKDFIDRSFISIYVNSYVKSFEQMVGKLIKAGVKFHNLSSNLKKYVDASRQDFIQIPSPDQIKMHQNYWICPQKSKQATFNGMDEYFSLEKSELITNPANDSEFPNYIIEDNKMNDTEILTKSAFKELDQIYDMETIKAINAAIKSETDNEANDESANETNEEQIFTGKTYSITGKESVRTITPELFNTIKPTMSEQEGINRVIERIKSMDENGVIEFKDVNRNEIPLKLLETTEKTFPVSELIEKSFYLASLFVSVASDKLVPFDDIAVDILIDCSSYIGDESKMIHMMILCAMTYALNAVEIPYSVALTSDDNFRCVIKEFDEQHSVKVLQRILDCLLIKRFRSKLANSLNYALKHMRYPEENRKHHAIFVLTDGLDENMKLTNQFAKLFFNRRENSFGFIFIKSNFLTGENHSILEGVWNKFIAETSNAESKINVSIITPKIEESTYKTLSNIFSILKRSSEQNEVSSKELLAPNFPQVLDNKLEKSNLDNLSKIIQEQFNYKQVYIHHENLPIIGSGVDKLDISLYRGKLKRLCHCETEDWAFNQKFILNKKFIAQERLQSIFTPNKASQTVLSSTGTEYDITALVLNIINPIPDPLIYLEEKGGLIRNYGITVVIDKSISCLSQLSYSHTIQTVRNLLSSLASLNLPFFDLILATDENPIVLCSETETTRALKDNSPLWSSVLSALYNPCPSTDLGSAIHTAFDLRRLRSSECGSFLFVLTDGLFEEKEAERIKKYINQCIQYGINTIGIGIGVYPIGIKEIFSQAVFAPNPLMLISAISYFFGSDLTDIIKDFPIISSQTTLSIVFLSTFLSTFFKKTIGRIGMQSP